MKPSTFNLHLPVLIVLFIFGVTIYGYSQTITGGCDKVTITHFPIYEYDLYLCCSWKTESDPCLDILVNG